ncbi:zinc finger protein ZFP2 isoform X10 [Aethina tumida]|uniref:zinc finger protein ZFP2 isoform X10 n=1 Tax=Aethina tumida TaxID=116153 RepID=UPI0021472EC3|nr:zinc finger protein ZFP2 isoform X10 [Aethina tumida]
MDNGGDILQLCRLCLVKDQVNIPIFEEQGDIRQIFLKISSCLPVKVTPDDKLPKKICDGCSCKLDMLYEFWNTTANAEKQLVSWLDQAGLKANTETADQTMSVVAQQVSSKPSETVVKEEAADEIFMEEITFSEKWEEASSSAGPSATITSDEPPPKRARRAAAVRASLNVAAESDDEDDLDTELTKIEDESEDEDDAEVDDPSYVDAPSTSADDQPGPSGVGKDGGDAPYFDPSILKNLIYGPGISITPIKQEPQESPVDDTQFSQYNGYDTSMMAQMLEPETNINEEYPDLKQQIKKEEEEVESSNKPKRKRTKRTKTEKVVHPEPVELDEPIHCDICTETYKNNVAFALHSINHSEDGKYSCHLCDYRNTSKYHIEMHVRAHEGTTKYKCEVCGKAFTVSTHAIEHKFFHTGEKPFQCEICGKHFMFSWFLTSHRRTQHWEIMTGSPLVKYDCLICNKHYTSSTGLKRHNLSKHNEAGTDMSVLCDVCGKRLSSKEKLKFHRRIHTGYKPYSCETCSKSFSRKEQLKEHERVHTGEKPFICKFCGRGFTQRSPLRIHERTHTGERPYVCMICGKGFISKGVMDTHMKSCSAVQYNASSGDNYD